MNVVSKYIDLASEPHGNGLKRSEQVAVQANVLSSRVRDETRMACSQRPQASLERRQCRPTAEACNITADTAEAEVTAAAAIGATEAAPRAVMLHVPGGRLEAIFSVLTCL